MARSTMRKAVFLSAAALFIVLFGCQTPSSGTDRSDSAGKEPVGVNRGIVRIQDEAGQNVGLYRGSYALVIGVSKYTRGWPRLPGVKKDVRAIREVLKNQGFTVEVVEDPDQATLEAAYRNFINRYGLDSDNRLLFYFAGHGYTYKPAYGNEDRERWLGYIVSRDAPRPDTDLPGFRDNAISMMRFEEWAKQIEAKHALFVFDSCFSGTIFAMTRGASENISHKAARPVRQFITAGSADQEVPDVSIFRRQFVAALEGEGDVTGDGYVTGSELGLFLEDKVTNYSKLAQTPQYGKIRDPLLDKGDFVFILKDPKGPSFQVNYVYQASGVGRAKPIKSGTVLHSGDHYKIKFTPDENAYVYIFQADSQGQFFQLFPMTSFKGVELNNTNPVSKGREYVLPAADKAFRLDDTRGKERLYFVASRGPRPELERLAAKLKQGAENVELGNYFRRKRGVAAVVSDKKVPVQSEDGQIFTVFQERLEKLCPQCAYVTEFEHR